MGRQVIMLVVRIFFGAMLLVGFIAAVYAAGEGSTQAAFRRQLAEQRVENEQLQRVAQRLAVENARLRADSDLGYWQGWADREAFERAMPPAPSLN